MKGDNFIGLIAFGAIAMGIFVEGLWPVTVLGTIWAYDLHLRQTYKLTRKGEI